MSAAGVIVADISALVAIVFAEPERHAFLRAIQQADKVLLTSVSAVETRMVVHGRSGEPAVVADQNQRSGLSEFAFCQATR